MYVEKTEEEKRAKWARMGDNKGKDKGKGKGKVKGKDKQGGEAS